MPKDDINRSMAARLREAREERYATAVEAARAMRLRNLHVKESTYLGHENGSRGLKPETAEIYSKFFRVRLAWLLTGDGNRDLNSNDFVDAEISLGDTIPEFDVRAGASYGGGLDAGGEFKVQGMSGHVPIAKWGLPATFVEGELGLHFGTADIISIQGNSMDDGSRYALISGDRVIIDRDATSIRQGGLFAIWDGEGVIIKQVEPVRGSAPPEIICKSLNPSYAPFNLILDGNAHIIGRVAAKISRM